MTRSYSIALDRAKAVEQAQNELPKLLVQLWCLRLEELQGSSQDAVQLPRDSNVPVSLKSRIRDLEDQVVSLQNRLVDAAGAIGLALYHEIVDRVVRSNEAAQEVFRLLQERRQTMADTTFDAGEG